MTYCKIRHRVENDECIKRKPRTPRPPGSPVVHNESVPSKNCEPACDANSECFSKGSTTDSPKCYCNKHSVLVDGKCVDGRKVL